MLAFELFARAVSYFPWPLRKSQKRYYCSLRWPSLPKKHCFHELWHTQVASLRNYFELCCWKLQRYSLSHFDGGAHSYVGSDLCSFSRDVSDPSKYCPQPLETLTCPVSSYHQAHLWLKYLRAKSPAFLLLCSIWVMLWQMPPLHDLSDKSRSRSTTCVSRHLSVDRSPIGYRLVRGDDEPWSSLVSTSLCFSEPCQHHLDLLSRPSSSSLSAFATTNQLLLLSS